jgi:hypothetical protein
VRFSTIGLAAEMRWFTECVDVEEGEVTGQQVHGGS